jgi:hypothetical protein
MRVVLHERMCGPEDMDCSGDGTSVTGGNLRGQDRRSCRAYGRASNRFWKFSLDDDRMEGVRVRVGVRVQNCLC